MYTYITTKVSDMSQDYQTQNTSHHEQIVTLQNKLNGVKYKENLCVTARKHTDKQTVTLSAPDYQGTPGKLM